MKNYKVVYRNDVGRVRATVCSYTEDLANDVADRFEDEGLEVLDIVEVEPGVSADEVEEAYK